MEQKKTKHKNEQVFEEEGKVDVFIGKYSQLSERQKVWYQRQLKMVLGLVVLCFMLVVVGLCRWDVGISIGQKGEQRIKLQKQIDSFDDNNRMQKNRLLESVGFGQGIGGVEKGKKGNLGDFKNDGEMYMNTKYLQLLQGSQDMMKYDGFVLESGINLELQNERKISLYEKNFEGYRMKVDFDRDLPEGERELLERHGFDRNIQLGSNFDYLNITKSDVFKKVRSQWESYFPYETFDILVDSAFERDPGLLEITNTFESRESLRSYILQKGNMLNKRVLDSQIFGLAVLLSAYPDDRLMQEIEYMYFDEKYKIGEISRELPICVFSIGYNVKSKNKHEQFFESLERQNYTNYKLVIVDDDSIDGSAQFFYDLINESKLKLRNRARIVHNLKRVGSTGNLIMRAKKFCDQDDIVVNIDTDDKFIGNQVFKIINAIYQDENIWSAFSRFIFRDLMKNIEFLFHSTVIPENYRAAIDNWSTTHLKTYRHKIISKIPLQYFIEYHYNQEIGMLQPHFFKSASDRYMVYSIIELSGLERVYFIDAVFYYYYYFPDTDPNCYRSHQRVDQYKARIKTPLKKLGSLDGVVEPLESYKVPEDVLFEMSKFYKIYQECIKIKKTRDLTIYQYKEPLKNTAQKLYNCKNFTLILSNSEKLNQNISSIHAKTIHKWVNSNNSSQMRQEMIRKSIHKCGIVIDLQFESYMLQYPEFQYIIVVTEEFDLLEGHLNRYIKSKKMFNNVSVGRMEVLPKVYAVIKFYKKMESTLTGVWNGNDRESIVKYLSPSFYPFLEKVLIDFYDGQKSKKILDVGCGLCLYASGFKAAKMVLTAYDGNPYTQQLSNRTAGVRDFSQKVYLGTKFDWVQSFNVGEYIPVPMYHNFINNLVHHATKGIILSWGVDDKQFGQKLGVKNPQTNKEIVKIMREHGFLIDYDLTQEMRSREGLESMRNSLMIFKRK